MNAFGRVALMGGLAIAGCSLERPGGQGGQTPPTSENATPATPTHKELGEASWYGGKFNGRETASGETFDQQALIAAHPSLPMGTQAVVTNLENGNKVEVTINDRGPYAKGRAIDLSGAAAKQLGMKKDGTADVKIVTKIPKRKKRVSSSLTKRHTIHQ